MTTTYQIIVDAYRQSNLIAIGVEPTRIQETEALRYLNRIVKGVFGFEAGDQLEGFPIGRKGIQRPSGFPWWDGVPDNDWFVPKNVRLNLNVEQSLNLYLHPQPDDGSRFAYTDSGQTLGTFPATVYGNGYLIDGQPSIVLDGSVHEQEFFFRADTGEWTRYSPLELFTVFPFPEEFDDFFILTLAYRLNPSYHITLDPQSAAILAKQTKMFKSRYKQIMPTRSELGLIRPAKTAIDRDLWGNQYYLYNPNAMFDKGWPF